MRERIYNSFLDLVEGGAKKRYKSNHLGAKLMKLSSPFRLAPLKANEFAKVLQ